MNINELTAKFQQHLRDKETSFGVGDEWANNIDKIDYFVDTSENEVVRRFHEFIKQMIKEGLIEIK